MKGSSCLLGVFKHAPCKYCLQEHATFKYSLMKCWVVAGLSLQKPASQSAGNYCLCIEVLERHEWVRLEGFFGLAVTSVCLGFLVGLGFYLFFQKVI